MTPLAAEEEQLQRSRCHAARPMGCEPGGRREAAICAAGSSCGPEKVAMLGLRL